MKKWGEFRELFQKFFFNFGTFREQTIEKFSNTTEDVWKNNLKNSDKLRENIRDILRKFWKNLRKIIGNCKNAKQSFQEFLEKQQ